MCEIGFIILRHVNNELTNKYWIHSYNCIRKYYPENIIMIVDDNSNYNYITPQKLYKTVIINSEFHKRGEILPYYYYLKFKLFDIAVVIHDSVFINKYIDFNLELLNYNYKFFWYFEHYFDNIVEETKLINIFNDPKLNEFYDNKNNWIGCFGSMCVIKHDYLTYINNKYEIGKLLNSLLDRNQRYSFERVFGCLLQTNQPKEVMFGNIYQYCPWGITYNEIENYKHLPLIKVWTGR